MRSALSVAGLILGSVAFTAPGLEVYVDRRPTADEVAANFTGAVHEPAYGCLIGAFIDQDSTLGTPIKDGTGRPRRLPAAFEKAVGRPHASYFFYMGYRSRLPQDWIEKLRDDGKMVHIALEPNLGLDSVRDDAYLETLAKDMQATGAKIFVRFASEMNGPWVQYSGDPAAYREKFRLVAKKMHALAPNVAMVWCPYAMPRQTIRSYYPGDEYVDWVGVNMYSVTYFNQDRRTPGKWTHPGDLLESVYTTYASKKPIMVGEYGATHHSNLESKSVADFAMGCVSAMYASLPRVYPRVKAIFYFNGNNMEIAEKQNNNYAVTQDPGVLDVYRREVSSAYYLERWPEPQAIEVEGIRLPVEPVDAKYSHEDPPPSPMPVRSGEILRGRVRLSAWIKDHLDKYTLRVTVGGRGVLFATVSQGWEGEIDTSTLPEGPTEIVAEAWERGRARVRKRVQVVIAR